MRIKKGIGILSVVLCTTTGCIVYANTFDQKSSNESSWNHKTIQMIMSSENPDGGFSTLIEERPISIYDTWFNVKLMKDMGYKIPNQEVLQNTLTNVENNQVPVIHSEVDLFNLDYLLSLDHELNINLPIQFKKSLIDTVLKIEEKDGLFEAPGSTAVVSKLLDTQTCLDILSKIGVKNKNEVLNTTLTRLIEHNPNLAPGYQWSIVSLVESIFSLNESPNFLFEHNNSIKGQIINAAKVDFNTQPVNKVELVNDIALYQLSNSINFAPKISSIFIEYLNQIRLKDGGFSLTSDSISDPKFSDDILNIYPQKERPNIDNLIKFTNRYQLSNGLFTPKLTSSDKLSTYMAIDSLLNLGQQPPQQALNFLGINVPPSNFGHVNLITGSYKTIQLNKVPLNSMDNLDSFVCIVLEHNSFSASEKQTIMSKLASLQRGGGYGLSSSPDYQTTYLVLLAMNHLQMHKEFSKTIKWITNEQLSDGGYGENLKSDLIDTYYALSICHILNIKPKDLNDLVRYLDNLKSNNGGFKFSSDSPVTLSATYYGTECIRLT